MFRFPALYVVLAAMLVGIGSARADLSGWGAPSPAPRTTFFAMPFLAAGNPLFMPRPRPAAAAAPATASVAGSFTAPPFLPGSGAPGDQCLTAIATSERANGIPHGLLSAIARVESGRSDGHGTVKPWPWSINVEGTDHVFDTERDAVAAVQDYIAQGIRSIDVGCLQVNLMYHPEAFASVADGFDPPKNAAYAAHFLRALFDRSGSWGEATAGYHSATPELGEPYRRKVESTWAAATGMPAGGLGGGRRSAESTPSPPPPGGSAAAATFASAPPRVAPFAAAGFVPPPTAINRTAASAGFTSRGLDAYRAAPVAIASNLGFRMVR
ncbi:MAG: hypothetical protein JO326_06555 [Acetobacteraceae bacterium]|nr:hypothetical protein [Acetobacteraceae bacterium]